MNADRAFPATFSNGGSDNVTAPTGEVVPPGRTWVDVGMSLRDYFAARALPQAVRHVVESFASDGEQFDWNTVYEETTTDVEMVAEMAYAMADAMLKARSA